MPAVLSLATALAQAAPDAVGRPPDAFDQHSMVASSAIILLTLFFLLAVSATTFWALLWRETWSRRSVALGEWARAAGFKSAGPAGPGDRVPPPLERFGPGVRVLARLTGKRCALVRFVVDRPAAAGEPAAATPPAALRRRHVLVWPVAADWPPVALRPAHAADALADLLALPVQLGQSTQRFAVCTADRAPARTISGSSARGLLPADIGMILLGPYLLIDFSDRPFDEVEFNRMIAVAEQVAGHLPAR